MALFSKQTVICPRCGKEYTARILNEGKLCDECYVELLNMQSEVQGYYDYAEAIGYKLSLAEAENILNHRNALLEKYRNDVDVEEQIMNTPKYLEDGSENPEFAEFVLSQILEYYGASRTALGGLWALSDHDAVFIDGDDVFAVTLSKGPKVENYESLMCTMFTNDPYVPVFRFVTLDEKKFGKKSSIKEFMTWRLGEDFDNLTYPIEDLKEFRKEIKLADPNQIKGNIDSAFLLKKLDQAVLGKGIFENSNLLADANKESLEMMNSIGYYTPEQIEYMLEKRDEADKAKARAEKKAARQAAGGGGFFGFKKPKS